MAKKTEVDGQEAFVAEGMPPFEERGEPAPKMRAPLASALQRAFDRKLIQGIVQPAKSIVCGHRDIIDHTLVHCISLAAFRYVDAEPCSTCGKVQKESHDQLCIVHMAMHIFDSERQTEMPFAGASAAAESDQQQGASIEEHTQRIGVVTPLVLSGKTGGLA